ncbi:hypothetical protein LIR51_26765 [Blautia producta]|uniref:hypothetical protein n=1 Tax=Blautia producta TaxID=33035 RepID=UPI001D042551|nr:hypothetical protein [Blautia producta]MCB5878414.1 hypothetical protein [Blautia producta]
MIIVNFSENNTYAEGYGLWQWDYGQIMRIQGLKLPTAVEIHFSMDGGEPITRIGTTKDGVTDVAIPDSILEHSGRYKAYIYITDEASGSTEYVVGGNVKERPKPESFDNKEDGELFREAIRAVNEAATRAGEHERQSERWAVGREDIPESIQDNAKYYAGQARDAVHVISGQVDDAKAHIDAYVQGKEQELKGDTGNVYFASFRVVNGRLKMYSDPAATKIAFRRIGSRLRYRVQTGG